MNDEHRVVVVGSGPCGAMAAMTLLGRGIPVTMLESGPRYDPGLLVRAFGMNVYRRGNPVSSPTPFVASGDPDTHWGDLLSPGGLSNIWAGAVPRFAPEDFTDGERLDERYRWPLTYEDLQPYYARVEPVLRIVGDPTSSPMLPAPLAAHRRTLIGEWRSVAAAAASAGHGMTLLPLAEGPPWLLQRAGRNFNSFLQIVRRLQRHPAFELRLGAHVLHLDWDGATKRVRSVSYLDRATNDRRRLDAAAIVLAAGPLASTRLLLSSTSADFPDGLGNTEGVLGHYLHDHPLKWYTFRLDRGLRRLGHTVYLTRAPYEESAPLLAASTAISSLSNYDRLLCHIPLKTRRFAAQMFGTMVPTQHNYVRLASSRRDEFGMPLLDIHIHHDDEARQTIESSAQRFRNIMAAAGYKVSPEDEPPIGPPGTASHWGGTVRMHSSPRYGVLDGWNRLHAVRNVAVVDTSAFTTGPEKNPTLTAMALAARAMDRLAADLRTGLNMTSTGYAGCSIVN